MGNLPTAREAVKAKCLPELAHQINEEHFAALGCAQTALNHAIEAGRFLAKAKAQAPHGQWTAWLREHFEGSPRTARGYIRLYKHRAEVNANRQSSANLSIDGALKYLAEPAGDDDDAEADEGDEYDVDSIPLDESDDEDEPGDEPDGDGEDGDEPDEDAGSTIDQTGQPLDMAGHPIPPHLVEIFQRRTELTDIQRDLSNLKTHVKRKVTEEDDPLYARIRLNRVTADAANLRRAFVAATPYAVCPYCTGDGCHACKDVGWLGRFEYQQVPDEIVATAYPADEAAA